MKNKLIAIGDLGQYLCFINLSKEEAIERYKQYFSNYDDPTKGVKIVELEFDNSFFAYDVWSIMGK